ncbi:MAG: histidine kinase [Hyphobacterium sp.]|nr:MAG: histidine kinase [Hyphobacterium sp.]
MDEDHRLTRRFGLRARLIGLVAIALLPVFALSTLQVVTDIRETSAERRMDILDRSHLFAHDQMTLIRSIRDLMQTILLVPDVQRPGPECERFLAAINAIDDAHTNFTMLGLNGGVRCSGSGTESTLDYSDTEWFNDIVEGEDFSIGRSRSGTLSSESVLVVAVPFLAEGQLAGVFATGVRIEFLEALGLEAQPGTRRIAGLVDRSGRVITQRENLNVGQISEARLQQAAGTETLVFDRQLNDGSRQTMALTSVFGDDLFVLLAQPSVPLWSWRNINVTASIILPIIMWGLAITVVWIASDFLVLRWLDYLSRFARLYGLGRYELKPQRTHKAPLEIREFSENLAWMAERIQERDEELQASLEQKQMLIREVHHRVKNNLQIITSLINLQLGKLQDNQSGNALRQAQTRINALAMIHRNLYEAENLTKIQITPFIEELARLTHEASTSHESGIDLIFNSNLADETLTTDQAVPVSMFITEAMTNAYKHAFNSDAGVKTLSVDLHLITDGGNGPCPVGFYP